MTQPCNCKTFTNTIQRNTEIMLTFALTEFVWAEGDGERTRQQTCVEKHSTAANCLYISGFWGQSPQTPTGAPHLDPAGDFRPPHSLCPPWLHSLATPLCKNCKRDSVVLKPHLAKQKCQEKKFSTPVPGSFIGLHATRQSLFHMSVNNCSSKYSRQKRRKTILGLHVD